MLELVLAKVFSPCFGPSNSSDIPLFKKFKAIWNEVDTHNVSYIPTNPQAADFKQSTIAFLQRDDILQMQVRDDYKELIELTLAVLGMPPTHIH